jgi:lysophospholipase L1-like esterase
MTHYALSASIALILLAGCGAIKSPSASPAASSARTAIVFIGDSITGEWQQPYNDQQATFISSGWTDLGVNGNTSAEILARFQTAILPLNPRVVQIIAGTNDTNTGWVLSDTSTNIQAMVALAKQQKIPDIILGTIPPWGPGPIAIGEDPVARFARISQLNDWIREFAWDQGIVLADYHAVLADPSDTDSYGPGLSFDGIHPSPTGYALMTGAVQMILEGGTTP